MKLFDFLFNGKKDKMPNFNESDFPANRELNKKRDMNRLLGICEGVISDGEINDKEKTYIKNWIFAHNLKDEFPANKILEKIETLQKTNLTDFIRDEIISKIVITYEQKEKLEALPIKIEYDCPRNIIFENKNYVLTGKFVLVSRSKVQDFIVSKGGNVTNRMTKSVDYLIVGTVSSRDWLQEEFGIKIKKAMKIKESNPIQIIDEDYFLNILCDNEL